MANHFLEAKETDLLKQLYSQGLKQSAILLSTILRRRAQINLGDIQVMSTAEIITKLSASQPVLRFNINNDGQGQGLIGVSSNLSLVLSDIMMGKDGLHPPSQMGQGELNIFSQIMGQFLASLAASLSQISNKKITFVVSDLKLSTIANEISALAVELFNPGLPSAVIISNLILENLIDEQIIQIIPLSIAREILSGVKTKTAKLGQKIEPLSLSPLEKGAVSSAGGLGSLLVDIPLHLSVELGRTKMALREILDLGIGSIIELDRLAGEPVDIMLNNKPLAKGEVVVIDENLGVRLTQISNPNERI